MRGIEKRRRAEILRVRLTQAIYRDHLLAYPGVVGIATGYKRVEGKVTPRLGVTALVREKKPAKDLAPQERIPVQLDGFPTDVVAVGDLVALNERLDWLRPVPGGIAFGRPDVSFGTLGAVVRDKKFGTRLMLSNSHVLAGLDQAQVGDPIIQPAAAFGGSLPDNLFGYLVRFEPLRFDESTRAPQSGLSPHVKSLLLRFSRQVRSQALAEILIRPGPGANQIDAAVARPVRESDLKEEIFELGPLTGVSSATLGIHVEKSGAASGVTQGEVILIDATIMVSYPGGRLARFENQVITTPMSKDGDSGSVLVSVLKREAIGLLFAGSPFISIYNPIQTVFNLLGLRL